MPEVEDKVEEDVSDDDILEAHSNAPGEMTKEKPGQRLSGLCSCGGHGEQAGDKSSASRAICRKRDIHADAQ